MKNTDSREVQMQWLGGGILVGIVMAFLVNESMQGDCENDNLRGIYHYSCGPYYKAGLIALGICTVLGALIGYLKARSIQRGV